MRNMLQEVVTVTRLNIWDITSVFCTVAMFVTVDIQI